MAVTILTQISTFTKMIEKHENIHFDIENNYCRTSKAIFILDTFYFLSINQLHALQRKANYNGHQLNFPAYSLPRTSTQPTKSTIY